MALLVQSIIACVLFTILILPRLYRDPVSMIMSYPPQVRERVKSLPQYKGTIRQVANKHIATKTIGAVLISFFLAIVAYFSGARDFLSAFFHTFILFFVVNIYDLLVLDILLFCHSKRLRIPGTEDMDEAYGGYFFHVIGAVKGTAIGAAIALLSAGMVSLFP